jgi:hypothetical protein
LRERQAGVAMVNEMFGTEISVDFGSAWKTNNESEERETEIVDTQSEDESDPISTDVGENSDENDGGTDNEIR